MMLCLFMDLHGRVCGWQVYLVFANIVIACAIKFQNTSIIGCDILSIIRGIPD